MPLYGLRWSFVPALVNGERALVQLETGAEDLSISRALADRLHIPVASRSIQWRGKPFTLQEAPATVVIGAELFFRPAAPVFRDTFADPIGGRWTDAMLGPAALEDRYVVSLDPFSNEVVFERATPAGQSP